MFDKYKKQIILAILVILILFILCFIVGFLYKKSSSKKEQRDGYGITSSFDKDGSIYIENILPVSDSIGREFTGDNTSKNIQGYSEFSIDNTSDYKSKYVIYLKESDKCSKTIDPSYIKLYLTDNKDKAIDGFDTNIIPSFADLSVLDDIPDGKLLYSSDLKGNSNIKFKLRVWVSDLYTLNQDKECFSFNIKVRGVY